MTSATSAANRLHNFYPGPAALPLAVLQSLQEAVVNFGGSGAGILELSHRSSEFEEIMASLKQRVRALLQVPDSHTLLFCTGGATQQFSMVPLNLLHEGELADYLLTGSWAKKAFGEAKRLRNAHQAASSADTGFRSIPKTFRCSSDSRYLHYTSNNTIYGTQWQTLPEAGEIPLVCDASSDLFSRPIDVARHDLIYAAAQKNFGPAGVTLVIIKESLLSRIPDGLPILMDFRSYAEHDSLLNTPPVFALFAMHEMLGWLQQQGGLSEIAEMHAKRAQQIYQLIDQHECYQGYAVAEDRSHMNVVFNLATTELEQTFLEEAATQGFLGLAGHRSIGGIRISLYNGVPSASVGALMSFLASFAEKHC